MKKAAVLLSLAVIFSLAACSGEGGAAGGRSSFNQAVGKSVEGEKLVGRVLAAAEQDYEKYSNGIYDVLIFTGGVCSEYYTYYFFEAPGDYEMALKSYEEAMLEPARVSDPAGLFFAAGGAAEEVLGEVTPDMSYDKISENWERYKTHTIIK